MEKRFNSPHKKIRNVYANTNGTEIEVNGTENKFHIKTIFDTELIIGGSDSNIINSIINTNVRSIIFKSVKILFYKYIFGLGISAKIPLPPIFDEE